MATTSPLDYIYSGLVNVLLSVATVWVSCTGEVYVLGVAQWFDTWCGIGRWVRGRVGVVRGRSWDHNALFIFVRTVTLSAH